MASEAELRLVRPEMSAGRSKLGTDWRPTGFLPVSDRVGL